MTTLSFDMYYKIMLMLDRETLLRYTLEDTTDLFGEHFWETKTKIDMGDIQKPSYLSWKTLYCANIVKVSYKIRKEHLSVMEWDSEHSIMKKSFKLTPDQEELILDDMGNELDPFLSSYILCMNKKKRLVYVITFDKNPDIWNYSSLDEMLRLELAHNTREPFREDPIPKDFSLEAYLEKYELDLDDGYTLQDVDPPMYYIYYSEFPPS